MGYSVPHSKDNDHLFWNFWVVSTGGGFCNWLLELIPKIEYQFYVPGLALVQKKEDEKGPVLAKKPGNQMDFFVLSLRG